MTNDDVLLPAGRGDAGADTSFLAQEHYGAGAALSEQDTVDRPRTQHCKVSGLKTRQVTKVA
jgi:hypothetical protein